MIAAGRIGSQHALGRRCGRRILLLAAGAAGVAGMMPTVRSVGRARAAVCEQDACLVRQWGSGWAPPGRLSSPKALALAPDGSLYVVDAGHDQIQRFTADGQFLTKFRIPGTERIPLQPRRQLGDLAVHPNGGVYVIDAPIALFLPPGQESTPDRVVRFTGDGQFVQEWGSRGSAPGEFFHPTGIAIDAAGTVLVADAGNRRVQRFTSDGRILDTWGTEGEEIGERATPVTAQPAAGEAVLVAPLRIAVAPDGSVWIGSLADIRQYRPDGVLLRVLPPTRVDVGGGFSEGLALAADGTLYVTQSGTLPGYVLVYGQDGAFRADWEVPGWPSGIDVDAEGAVYVTGGSAAPLQKFDGAGRLIAWWGGRSVNPALGELDTPQGIAVDAERTVYVADSGNERVQIFSSTGSVLGQWTGEGLGLRRSLQPFDLAIGPGSDVVTILDDRRAIVLVSRDGRLLREWPVTERAGCSSVTVDPQGRIFVAAEVVRVFSADGTPLSAWPPVASGAGPQPEPWAVAADAAGNVYVTGLERNAVAKFTAEGEPLATWSGAGMGGEELLGYPDLAVDGDGNVYVGHYTLVQKWSGDGTLLAAWDSAGPQEPGHPALSGLTVDRDGYVYVVEGTNNLVKSFAQRGQDI